MSMFTMRTACRSGSVGCATQYLEPSKPFSSPSKNANRTDRRGVSGSKAEARARESSPEVPLALSSAPLWILPIGPRLLPGRP